MGAYNAFKSHQILPSKIQNLELDLGCLCPDSSPLPRYLLHTSSWTWGRAPFLLLSQTCCRSPRCIHCHHRTRGRAVFLPMSPCHKGAAFLQTQRAGSQDELVGVDYLGCYHAKISTNTRREVGENTQRRISITQMLWGGNDNSKSRSKSFLCLLKYLSPLSTLCNRQAGTVILVFHIKILRLGNFK